jgi:beta-galactosidase GanA
MTHSCIALVLALILSQLGVTPPSDLPHFREENGTQQFVVHGKPFVILGGELGNSSAGTAVQADLILPEMARIHLNTVLMPVAWEQTEPTEGYFDFRVLDHWIDVARQQNLHLVLLWFGSWKNAFSEYAPDWVKADINRVPRAQTASGTPLEILSTFGTETLRMDSRAFAALMSHLREKDREQQTVLMVQVENEVGYLGPGRDRRLEANRQFAGPVPRELTEKLLAKRAELSPELGAHFNAQGSTWREVFGEAATEVFMAWRYASYIDSVAQAGKKQYPLPMYVNAQLPSLTERPGEYPSGGPHPYYLEVYRAVAPGIDFYSPDIYWPEFEYWVRRYQIQGNPIFIPEAKIESAPYNALYAYGAAKAFGFCPFGIDSLHAPASSTDPKPAIMQAYAALSSLGDMLATAQSTGRTRGVVLHANSPRGAQSVSLGGYLFEASLSRAWKTGTLLADDGAMLLLESRPDEFIVVGSGLTVKMSRDPDTDNQIAGISSIEQVSKTGSEWVVSARLNGDQSNQGRQLTMDPREIRTYRIRLYSVSQ